MAESTGRNELGTLAKLPLELRQKVHGACIAINSHSVPERVYEQAIKRTTKKPHMEWSSNEKFDGIYAASFQISREYNDILKFYMRYKLELTLAELEDPQEMEELLCGDPMPIWAADVHLIVNLEGISNTDGEGKDRTSTIIDPWSTRRGYVEPLLLLIKKFQKASMIRVEITGPTYQGTLVHITHIMRLLADSFWVSRIYPADLQTRHRLVEAYHDLKLKIESLISDRKRMPRVQSYEVLHEDLKNFNVVIGEFQTKGEREAWEKANSPFAKYRREQNEAHKQEILRLMRDMRIQSGQDTMVLDVLIKEEGD